jgi:hypothetical protein
VAVIWVGEDECSTDNRTDDAVGKGGSFVGKVWERCVGVDCDGRVGGPGDESLAAGRASDGVD